MVVEVKGASNEREFKQPVISDIPMKQNLNPTTALGKRNRNIPCHAHDFVWMPATLAAAPCSLSALLANWLDRSLMNPERLREQN